MFLILIVLAINFFISWCNANYCGRYWSESKVTKGFFRFNVIIGYIMAIAGFTMVYGCILLMLLPYIIPLIPQLESVDVSQLTQLVSDMLYLLIVITIVPIGFFIWFQSITVFWKKKNLGNGLTAGWNSYAQIHNTVSAMRNAPSAFKRVTEALFGGKGKKKAETMVILIAIFVIILAILGGYFTASAIMKKADKKYDALVER